MSKTGIRLKYVHQWVDTRSGGARARYYFRRDGRRIPLPGLPGSDEFMEAYRAALTMQLPRPMIGANRTKSGSISALIVSYLSKPEFLSRPKSTQTTHIGHRQSEICAARDEVAQTLCHNRPPHVAGEWASELS